MGEEQHSPVLEQMVEFETFLDEGQILRKAANITGVNGAPIRQQSTLTNQPEFGRAKIDSKHYKIGIEPGSFANKAESILTLENEPIEFDIIKASKKKSKISDKEKTKGAVIGGYAKLKAVNITGPGGAAIVGSKSDRELAANILDLKTYRKPMASLSSLENDHEVIVKSLIEKTTVESSTDQEVESAAKVTEEPDAKESKT